MEQQAAEVVSYFHGTFWALVPSVVAIVLALITKEAYSSLFVGVLMGGLFISEGNFPHFLDAVFKDGMVKQVSDPWNVGILFFLVILGTMVALMNKSGGAAAFGEWAKQHIKSKVGAQLATVILGILIFVDDYFNCLTVGSVMRPVTDKFKLSHEKLAYLIDATAAPICIIAPISSWAAAVTGFVEGEELQDLGLVFQEEVVPAGIPATHEYQATVSHHLLLTAVVGSLGVEPHGGYQSPLRGVFRKEVVPQMVVARVADMEPRVFIGEAHRHRGAPMLTAPGIHMSVLQHIVGHAALVVNEYHSSPFRFLITSSGSRLTRPVSLS